MKRALALLVAAFTGLSGWTALAAEKPIVMLFERNPWLMVVGSDSPLFAYYESGLTIFWDEAANGGGAYKSIKLAREKADELFMRQLKPLMDLDKRYQLTVWTDQPTQELFLEIEGRRKTISIYGDLRRNEEVRAEAPDYLRMAYDSLISFSPEQAETWQPEQLEVLAWPYEHAPDESIAWPADWPGIDSPSTRQHGDLYSIFLPFENYGAFEKLLATRRERGAVLISGRKWAVSARLPFPHELGPED